MAESQQSGELPVISVDFSISWTREGRASLISAGTSPHKEDGSMALKFAGTMNAINRGLEKTVAAKGADMIEDWEAALADVDIPGAKGILRDLGSLRKQLEKGEPDADRVHALLHRLGTATTKIAEKSDKSSDKLKSLGEALTEAGEEEPEEEEDAAAAAAPKRARKKS